jgi:hypothetical protein
MKMEAQLTWPHDDTIKTILVHSGEQINAKDFLIEFAQNQHYFFGYKKEVFIYTISFSNCL